MTRAVLRPEKNFPGGIVTLNGTNAGIHFARDFSRIEGLIRTDAEQRKYSPARPTEEEIAKPVPVLI